MENCILSQTNLCYDMINIVKDFYLGDKNYWEMQYKKCMENINYLSKDNKSINIFIDMTFKENIFMLMSKYCYYTDDGEDDSLDYKKEYDVKMKSYIDEILQRNSLLKKNVCQEEKK